MAISQALLPEFDHEMQTTRKVLERVPEGNYDWAPHEKSMSIGRLAGHIAEMVGWVPVTLSQDHFDVSAGGANQGPTIATSHIALLEMFDGSVATARQAIAEATDEQMMKTWSLQSGDKVLFSMPRAAVLRTFVMNHVIHHRGQLSVYLRLKNIPVPSIYGPSADENTFAAAS